MGCLLVAKVACRVMMIKQLVVLAQMDGRTDRQKGRRGEGLVATPTKTDVLIDSVL